ncbi:scyllo-inosamine-4-phosphate amidinotransferase [Micromonospora sp. HUAS LYJ1]|uniref:scyllo-inosamine-4-phosphate amidinotransferase n=1 Tax=Micromonospora sp. HUAS LYJ1 TaxID=3061626 RepID=UPI002671F9AF|nr:scyllo-inosamine-4-phosphate amidinotransferase [Micromonospora sp. HUAS LYJ1]WKU03687.1 scyllo-inosamine-4-phosphate amidinotransferase [Micromonospora sp. HUAS LYJ1]
MTEVVPTRDPGVWSCNEWDPLVEVIVGNPLKARLPHPDESTRVAEFPGSAVEQIPTGEFPSSVIEETEEDLAAMVKSLEDLGVVVRRPETWPHDHEISTPFWSSKGFYNYCPRDIFLVVGDQIIETPNVMRGRLLETYSYRKILVEYLRAGAKWYSAPRPMLLDSLFDVDPSCPVPTDDEPVFDAANVLRLGRDLVYLVSSTGNELGARWLQTVLGDEYRVHLCRINYHGSHIDTSLVALRPGLLLCNPERVTRDMLPPIFDNWTVLYSPPMVGADRFDSEYLSRTIGSRWIDMNLFSVRPDLVVVDRDQAPLIRLLEKNGLDVLSLKLRHSRMLGGGFHCTTLDTRRRGAMESYFEGSVVS